jgi:hypothetical protein
MGVSIRRKKSEVQNFFKGLKFSIVDCWNYVKKDGTGRKTEWKRKLGQLNDSAIDNDNREWMLKEVSCILHEETRFSFPC